MHHFSCKQCGYRLSNAGYVLCGFCAEKELRRLQAEYVKLAQRFYDTFHMAATLLGATAAPCEFEDSDYGKEARAIAYGEVAKTKGGD